MRISIHAENTETLLAELFRALGHPLRLWIIRLLLVRPMCVCRLMAALGAPQSSVSRHLAILRRAGVVHPHQCGQFVRYELNEEFMGQPLRPVLELIERLMPDTYDEEVVEERLAELGVTPPPH